MRYFAIIIALVVALLIPASALASNHNGYTPPSVSCATHQPRSKVLDLYARGVRCPIARDVERRILRGAPRVITIHGPNGFDASFHSERMRWAHGHTYVTWGVGIVSVTIVYPFDNRG